MAKTVSEGLDAIANADLSKLSDALAAKHAEYMKVLDADKAQPAKIAQMTIDELIAALETAKRRAT